MIKVTRKFPNLKKRCLKLFSTLSPLKATKKQILYEQDGKRICDFKLMD